MTPKCGEVRVRHWAHRGRRHCDPWWDNKTEWHRRWQDLFPIDWQEARHQAEDGEWHIADVKTDAGWVLEFQYSHIKPEERRARDAFYEKLVWVVNGKRRKRDEPQFADAYDRGRSIGPLRRVPSDTGALFREWTGSKVHVFFDFGAHFIWWLSPDSDGNWAYLLRMPREQFVGLHRAAGDGRSDGFDEFAHEFSQLVARVNNALLRPPTVIRRRPYRRGRRL
jgi:hypothetical protein